MQRTRQSRDGLEIGARALAQKDGHGLCASSVCWPDFHQRGVTNRAFIGGAVGDALSLADGHWGGHTSETERSRLGGSERGEAGDNDGFGKHDCCRRDGRAKWVYATRMAV